MMRVLLVSHGYPPASSGGTEIYTRSLAHALARQGCDVTVLTRTGDRLRPEHSVARETDGPIPVIRVNNTFQACGSFEESYTNPGLARIAAREIARIAPDIVHVQHLTCLSTDLPAVAAELEIPVVMTLNDYWLICHRGQLFDREFRRCDGPFDEGCARCVPAGALASPRVVRAGRLARSSAIPGAGLLAAAGTRVLAATRTPADVRRASRRRLDHMRAAVRGVDLFLAPSRTLEERFRRFGIPADRLRRCEQGIDLAPFSRHRRLASGVLRVGFAGGLMPSKGVHVLLAAAATLPPDRILVDILGDTGAPGEDAGHEARLQPLLAGSFVRKIGPVPHERMAEALAAVDVVAVPSLWIENAPFIIREAFASGAPVVASDLGGMAEMVRHQRDGLLFEPGNVGALASILDRLSRDPDLVERLRAGIRRPCSIDEDAAALCEVYSSRRRRSGAARQVGALAPSTAIGAVVLNYRTPDQSWLAARTLQSSERPPNRIVIVDNHSMDGSAEWLRASLSGVDILETPSNLGFGGGCQAGIRRLLEAGVDHVLLVNSDVAVHPGALAALEAAAAADPAAGIFGPVLLSREEPDRIASAGISFDRASGRMRQRAAGRTVSLLQSAAAHEVDAVSGAVMLIRAEVLRRVAFDPEYFMYFEDIDFCLRARDAGFGSRCVPDAIAYHEGGRSVGRRSSRRAYFATRNHLRLAGRAGPGGPLARTARAAFVVALNAAHASLSRDVPFAGGLLAVARGTCDHIRGRYGPD